MSEILVRRNTVLETLRGSRREIFSLWVHRGQETTGSYPVHQ
jgi:hypothetical protein